MATKKTDQTKAKFTVLSPVDYNNERYEIGEPVEMTVSEAASLVAQGIVEATPAVAAA